jgi:hypothetical protein
VDFSFAVLLVEDWEKKDGAIGEDCVLWDEVVETELAYPVLCEPTGDLGKDATTIWTGGLPNVCVVDPNMKLLGCGNRGVEFGFDQIRQALESAAK